MSKRKKTGNQPTPEPQPRFNPISVEKIKQAVEGKLTAHFAFVPFYLLQPFDKAYFPLLTRRGLVVTWNLIQGIFERKSPVLWVYSADGMYVFSDDYFAYEAHGILNAEYVPCIILGDLLPRDLKGLRSPLTVDDLLGAMGL